MRRLNGSYTQYFNRRHDRVGHVLQGRYKAILVDRDAFRLELCRYTVLNPVRAGLVAVPDLWHWSSHTAILGQAPCPDWLARDQVLGLFGSSPSEARAAYVRFVEDGIGAPSPWSKTKGQIYLGHEDFLQRMQRLASTVVSSDIPLAQRRPARPDPDAVLRRVSEAYGISLEQVFKHRSQHPFRAAVYLLRRVANLPLKEVAARASVSPSRVSQIQTAIERNGADERLAELLREYGN